MENFSVSLSIYFDYKELNISNYLKWQNELLFFKPKQMRGTYLTKGKTQAYNIKKLQNGLNYEFQSGENFTLRLNDENNNTFALTNNPYGHRNAKLLLIIKNSDNFKSIYEYIELVDRFFILHKGINAHIGSSYDSLMQNANLNYYQWAGLPTKHLHFKPDHLNPNELDVDTEYNPGHSHYPHNLWFGSCWAMWFGEEYYKYISKEALKSFKDCYENIELENGAIRILLHENIWDYDKPENRQRQWAFRQQVGIDEAAHLLENTPIVSDNNPSIEITDGNFEHGGAKMIKYYYNDEGDLVPKSRATKCRICERSADGKILWTGVEKLR